MTRSNSTESGGYVDLILVVALVAVTTAALLVPNVPRAIEVVFGVPFLLVAPGYVLVAVLFPVAPSTGESPPDRSDAPGWIVRLALTVVGSVLILGGIGVALSFVGRLRLVTAILAIDTIVSVGVVATLARRRGVVAAERADPLRVVTTRQLSGHLGLSSVQTLALAISVLVLAGAVAFVGTTPAPADPYSEASLLAGDGTLLGANGTATFETGTETALILRLENHEGSDTSYEIVGQFQQLGPNGTVLETWVVDRDTVTVADGERVDIERGIEPTTTADRLRLRYLVYTGAVPDNPSGANADLSVRQWVEVVPEGPA